MLSRVKEIAEKWKKEYRPITFSEHFLMTMASSETTRSTHFKLGSLSFIICFFTIASKAISGVKSPVLHHAESMNTKGEIPKNRGKMTEREKEIEKVSSVQNEKAAALLQEDPS